MAYNIYHCVGVCVCVGLVTRQSATEQIISSFHFINSSDARCAQPKPAALIVNLRKTDWLRSDENRLKKQFYCMRERKTNGAILRL